MRARFTAPLVLLLLLASVALAGCTGPREGESQERGQTTVRVENQRNQAVVIYAVRSGQRRRIGRVSAASTEVFDLPRGLIFEGGTPLRFQIDFLGADRPPLTREVVVYPGDQVELAVPSF